MALGALTLSAGVILIIVRNPGFVIYGWKVVAALMLLGITVSRSTYVVSLSRYNAKITSRIKRVARAEVLRR